MRDAESLRRYAFIMASKAIRAFDYDDARNELTVTFSRGPAYVYSLVPAAVATAFAASPSPGAFHNAHLRDRYPFRKVKAAAGPSRALRELLAASVDGDGDGPAAPPVPVLGMDRR